MGTSEWWIDDSDNTLHLGAGQLADANVQFDDNAEVTDWGNVGWGQYVEAHDAKLTLLLEGSVAVGANARGLFNGLTFDLSNEEYPRSFFSQISVKQTTDMSYMFERATFMASGVFLNDWYSLADSVNASHMFENVKCISNASQYDKRVLATLPDLAEAYSDTSYMFNNSGFSSIAMASDASDASKLTSQVTSMAYMFNNCTQLMSLDLSKFDTHNVTDMSHMFNGDENLGKLVISTYSPNNPDQTFDTRNVTNMSHMFTRCDALGNLDVSGFITSKVTNMSHMFDYCYATTLDVANFDTSQVTDMQAMFNGAVHVKTLDLSNFDTHLITNMDNMFTSCESLTSLILPTHFVDQQVTSMKQMFTNCATLTSIDLVDAFDTSNVTNMDQLFSGCQKLTSLDVSQLDTSHITNMADFFNDCESLTNIEGLTHLNTAAVTTMANMFSNCRSLTALDLSNFETSRVTTMANMFNNCASLPALDVSSLDTSQVVNMANMFAGCAALSALDTTPLKTTNVTNMSGMFKGDRALVSLDISKLGTGQVTTMSHMFEDVFADQKAQSFTGLEKLDTSNVTDMSYMFAGFFLPVAMSLNLVNFDTRKVLNMQGMFKGYVNFKDNYLSYLQTGNVTDMSYMLSGLVNHTQFTWSDNLDTHSVTTMAYMFSDSPDMETFVWKQQLGMDQVTNMQGMFANDIALVNVNFEQFDTSQVTDMTAMFSGDTRLERLDLTSFDTSNVQHMYKMFYLDSALKNLNLSSFSGEKLQFNYPTVWALFGLFNLPIVVDSDGNQQIGQYQTYLSTLTLGCKTRLSLPKPTSIVDWFDTSQVSQEEIQEILATFPTVEALEEALAESGLKPDWLVSADLAPSQGFDGVWINNATAETLTSEQLMARYDGTNPLATDATWTWQNILGKDLQVISGTNSTWAPKDSLAGLIDTSKTVDDLTTTVTDTATNQTLTSSQLNALLQQPAHSGQYQVAYQYIDGDGTKQISVPVTLSLVTNQSLITAKDSVLQLGTTWIAADNIASLLDADGSVTDLTKVNGVVSVNGIENGTVDTAIPGIYQIDYQITDSTGTVRTATATVIVNGLTLKETQVNVSTDDRWDPLTNIAKAIDDQGNEATVELTITDANDVAVANIKKPGTYQLNYHFTDAHGEHTATAAVNVKADENHADLQVKDSRVYQFGTWTSTDNFVSAMDSDGETLDISALSVTGTVDLNQVGKYTITYQFTDQFGVAHSAQATVEVLENQAAINIDNNSGTLYANGIWNPASVVVNATDVDGTVVEDSEIKRSGTVDVTTPGDYKLTYSFVDSLGEEHSKDTTVTVLENLAGIKVKSITESFRIGAKWSEENNFDSATDVDGTSIDLADVDVVSTVDPKTVGQYKVTYSFTDQQGRIREIAVPVEVLANLADIRVKSKTESFRIGAKWSEKDNFDSATDVDGTPIDLADVEINSTVDPEKVGQYKVTYSFTDQQGQLRQADVMVKVLENLAGIKVKSATESFRIGAKWSKEENFDSATDVDGTSIDLSDLDIISTVDSTTVGQYKVTYSFTDQQGKLRSVEVPVEVLSNLAGIKVKSTTESFRIGAKWSEKDNFDGATDVDGTPIDLADVDITSTVDPEKVGQYKVTYSFADQQGQLRQADATVKVLENLADIKVKSTTESFRIGAKWSEKDNFDGATDVDGSPIDLADVNITSTVDPTTVGQYKVTYSFTDQQGKLRSVEVPVEVLANMAGIKVKSKTESFRIGAKWSEKDNFDGATDVDGTPIDLADVDVISTVDPKTIGQYKVTYSFTDQQGELRSIEVPVEVLANLAGIKVKSTAESFRIGAKWSEEDNFDSATDVDGTPINLSNIDIESTVNSEVAGQYKVTYSFTDQQGKLRSAEIPVEVLANLAGIKVKSTTESFRIGAKWSEKDNFDSATDVDGTPINLSNIDIESTVNSEVAGQYKVTYSFTDQQGNIRSVEVPVEVLANLAGIRIKSTTESFRIGAKWSAEDNFDSATDVDGTSVDLADVDIVSTVNPKTVGRYKVTYSFTDQQGRLQKVDVKVEVLANLAGIKAKSTTESFRIGAKWSEEDNFDSATDVDGTPIDLADVYITSTVDPKRVGQYKVTYSFTDQQGQLRNADVMVEVLENLAGIRVKSTTESFRMGAKWSAEDNFDSATDVDGTSINLADVNITSTVDPEKVGQYKVTYSFTDQQGQFRKAYVTVNVLANLAGIRVKSTTESFRIGAKWSAKDNLDSATDVDGTSIDLADVDITSTVDSKEVGQYKVTYSFTDQQGKLRSVEVQIEVLANLAGIKVKSATESFRIGAKWSEEDNFDSATDVDGTLIDLADVDITSTVDSKAVGQYKVTYSFTDQQGKLRSVEVPVEVLANLAGISAKSATESFRIGAKWSAKDNFEGATDVEGTPIDLADVDITSTVDPEKVGQYKVTYSFTDQQGQLRKADVTVDVLANLAGIKVKSTTESFRIGAKWSAEDNFDSATDVDGTPIDLADVDITSTVDPEKVGQYKVTYSFTDQQGQLRKADVTIDVLANLAGIKVKSTTESFRIGAKWSAKDNFEGATDVDGTPIDLADVDIESTVNPEVVGQYTVTYSFTDQQGKLRSVEVPVEVLANLAGIKVKSTTESFRIGAKWSEKDNFDRATNVDGTPVDLADVDITSTVDSKAVGQYTVTYSFTGQQGTVQQVIVPVNVLANYANLQLNQTELSFRAGDNRWQPESNIAAATDIDGRAIDLATMQITNAVDSTTPGTYLVNYAFTDSFNQTHRATATVTVLDNLAALTMTQQHVTLYLGNRQWQPEDNFGGAKNVDGSVITYDQLQVLGHYDLKVVGDYELTYQFTDQLDHLRTAQFTVTVAENQATIVVEKTAVTLHVGDTWEPMMNFVSATDMDGQVLAEDWISVNVTKLNQRLRLMMMRSRTLPIVDTTVVGSYQVSYQFIDGNGNLQELATTVTVLPNESVLKLAANDITLYAGDEWQPMANVVKATNVDGTPVTADQIRISGSVNPNVVGQYRVLYSFVDQQDKLQQAVTTVNVLANQAALLLKHDQVALTVGDEWQPVTNLQLARDVDGHEIASTDLAIDGQVDTATPGTYQVRYHFTDMRGHEQQAVVMVTVVEPAVVDQALLRLHTETVTLRAGATWAPLSNVAEVLDSDGSAQTSEQVSVQGTVDLNQAGKYLLTYHFLDQLGHDHSATATIIVLENEASLKLRTTAVTLKVGQKWDAFANILAATDVDGRSINEAVVITGDVDWQHSGIYQLTYELVDQQGKLHSATTMITLIAADDDSGNQGGNGNTDNGSGNQGGNGNTDNGSGNQGGNGNTDNGSGNQGGNGNTNDGSSNQGGNGNTDNGSGNQDGNSDADNGSGNQDGNGNTDTNSDNQSTKADDDTVSNDNLNTNHQIDTDTIHDAGNNSGQKEVAKPNPVSHENGANATVKAAVAKHQSVTTASVKSTTNTNTNEQPSVGSPTQLPQTDEHNAGTTNWWPWLGIALAGLITMVKPTKKKEK
ncbi:bacterial Ig-like domain-containing protein [Lactiplantibacillus pentosus]|uniref:bacterial Ig-like domain-containing protein n=1 Tax=Lactiplantibacillus pentosus TaxID=1589 RepID=UPI001ADD7186|nr:bacterial Ig-like domain-containing protein [Lactiplantibacillus pentosus]MBO9166028.1 bacterial Ig-like domain-containing protein [Lactiplantibacillus pentosus]